MRMQDFGVQAMVTGFWRGAMLLLSACLLLAVAACGGSDGDVAVDRGPTTIVIDAKLNGLYWDAQQARLYLTDDDANAIRAWDGDEAFPVAAELPPLGDEQRTTLGQLTRGADGVLYTTRFGFSEYGAIVAAPDAGDAYNLEGPEVERRRIGITPGPGGTLITGWFRGGGAETPSGAISEVQLDGDQASERELVTGLSKPTGVVVVGDHLYVADQSESVVLRYSLTAARVQAAMAADGEVVAQFAADEGPDLMTADEDGVLYLGTGAGKLYAIDPDGAVDTLATGWPGIRGVAWDGDARRLFAAVAPDAGEEQASIRIVPVD